MKKILIIDDEHVIRSMLRSFFEKFNYEVLEASNGNQGVALFKEHKPDLIITDLVMPEKEGLETIREIRKLDHNIKIIAMSGGGIASSDSYLQVAKKFGAQYSFDKPINLEELLAAVKSLLGD
jgi:DNA-binding response OmpR family regulator